MEGILNNIFCPVNRCQNVFFLQGVSNFLMYLGWPSWIGSGNWTFLEIILSETYWKLAYVFVWIWLYLRAYWRDFVTLKPPELVWFYGFRCGLHKLCTTVVTVIVMVITTKRNKWCLTHCFALRPFIGGRKLAEERIGMFFLHVFLLG